MTRQRGPDDWVRVVSGDRIAYWDGGAVGVGARRFRNCKNLPGGAEGERRRLLADASRIQGLKIGPDATWADLCQKWFDAHDGGKAKEGTLRKRLSDMNAWVVPFAGRTRLIDTKLATKMTVLDAVVAGGRQGPTLSSVNSTLNVIADWAVERSFLPADSFGPESVQKSAVRKLRNQIAAASRPVAANDGDSDRGICFEDVPTHDDVEVLAEKVVDVAGGELASRSAGELYGDVVRLAAGTGLRQCELLALTVDRVNLDAGSVFVDRQYNRYKAWLDGEPMATTPPKHGRARHVGIAGWAEPAVRRLVDAAVERGDGLLVPNLYPVTWWPERWGKLLLAARDEADWMWAPHYLRHHYASYMLEPRESGGYGRSVVEVQRALGHTKPSVTTDVYWQRPTSQVGWVR